MITSLNNESLLLYFITNGTYLMEQTGEIDDFNYYLKLIQERIIPLLSVSGYTTNKVKDTYMDLFLSLFSVAFSAENYSLALEILAMSKNQNFNFALLNRHNLEQKDLKTLYNNSKTIIGYDLLKEKNSKNVAEINIINKLNYDYLFDMLAVQSYKPFVNYNETLKNGGFYLETKDSLITKEYGSLANGLKNFRFGLINSINKEFSINLYRYLVEPYFKDLIAKSNFYEDIIIVPDNNFSIIPFEALQDSSGKFLVEKFNITYNQSLKSYYTLLSIQDKGFKKPLVFANPNYNTQKIDSGLRGLYNDLDYGNWSSLPFSESEANYIEKYLPNTTTLTGSKANEKNINRSISKITI